MLSDRKVPNDLIDSFLLVGGATTSTSTGRDESWYEDESNRIGGASPPAPLTVVVQLKWPCNDRLSSRKRRTFNLDELTSSQKDGSGTERNGAKWTSGGGEEDDIDYLRIVLSVMSFGLGGK